MSITIALSKGRLADFAIEVLERAGLKLNSLKEKTRKLILQDETKKYNFIFLKPVDVPTYVERGAADLGFVGKDTLLEEGKNVYELIDLKKADCKICVCGKVDFDIQSLKRNLKVATKYTNIAKRYFHEIGFEVDIIKLNGSVELAPLINLADCIVDVVETGKTLEANGLKVLEVIAASSLRLIANKASLKTKGDLIKPILEGVRG